ncbi:MAG: hypothetical protein HY303_21800 [Candidatus Wallbacteria bacterium]|nr:hypothetical protein [Candidatus Wallbacteria bacterium]
MSFEEDVPQLHLGPFHAIVVTCLLAFLGIVIYQQMVVFGWKARRATCLARQKLIQDCIAVWENEHGNFPVGTNGWAAFTRRDGVVFKTEGLPPAFKGDAISHCTGMQPWCCPEELYKDFDKDPARVPEDHGRHGFGSYCFVQDDKPATDPPLFQYVASAPPFRLAICSVFGGKQQLGADGRPGSRHSDHW